MAVLLTVVAVLGGVGAAALLSVRPPSAVGADAPPEAFSATRALAHVRVVGARPHVAGSEAADRVREYLLTTLRGLDLDPQVQDTVATSGAAASRTGTVELARVRNVVAVLPGTASTSRVFLVAHYDSVQNGPGGNDDAVGVGALLESARALAVAPRPRNDIVFVLTDAEEACLCGAAAFVDRHPLAADGGVVLNMEARGRTGPAIMFETSRGNAALVAAYARTPHPVGTSVAVEIYRRLPNDTDFTPFLAAGFAGLNTAYIDGAAVYHTALDTPDAVDPASLQHHGDNALALLRTLGDTDLPLPRGGDATYFPVPGGLARYPGRATWPVAVLAALTVAALAIAAVRRGTVSGTRLVAGFGLTVIPLVVAPTLATLWFSVLTRLRPGYAELLDPYRPTVFRLAVLAMTAAVVLAWYAALRRRIGPFALAAGALGWSAVLGLVLAAYAPGGSYLGALPALAGAVAGLAALWLPEPWRPAAWTAGVAVAMVVILPLVMLLFPALGLAMGGVAALLTALLVLVALPVVELLHRPTAAAGRRWWAAAPTTVALLAAAALTTVGLHVDRFDAAHPSPTHLMYALDADTGRARWLSAESTPQPWTAGFVADREDVVDEFPFLGTAELRAGPAVPAALPAPELTTASDTRTGDVRSLSLRLTPRRPARLVALHVAGADTVVTATVAGQPVPVSRTAGDRWGFGFVFHAPPADGVGIQLTVRGAGPVTVRVMDGSDGLSELPGFRPRPPAVGVAGSHTSELVAVAHTITL